jgi:hypothetical protein
VSVEDEIKAYVLNSGRSVSSLLHNNMSADPYLSLHVLDLLGVHPTFITVEEWAQMQSDFKAVLVRFNCPIDHKHRHALNYLCKVLLVPFVYVHINYTLFNCICLNPRIPLKKHYNKLIRA